MKTIVATFGILVVFFLFRSSSALKLPSYIKPCSKDDPKLNECALKHGREAIPKLYKGDPKYRVPSLQPLEVDEITVGDGAQGSIGLKMTCKKCKFFGIENSNLEDIKIDLKKKHIHLEISNPKINLKGKYTASGKVLVLPITGDGDADISLDNVKITYDADYEPFKKSNKEHLKLKNPELKFNTSKLSFHLTNLFNGDKLLGDNMNTFLNENWQEVLKEFGPAVSETLSQVMTIIVNNIAELVPTDEIFTS